MEIDAHETLKSADDLITYFHPGGGPDQYLKNYIEHGQYGHIARYDLIGRIKLDPTPNGKPTSVRSGRNYYVTPTRIPHDMWYKPNVKNGKSGSRYFTYGNPGYDKTYGRGDWTYISWSWVQLGGRQYPANKNDGGGIARALLKRGMPLVACEVKPILGMSWGPDNQPNGRVTAFYARTYTGPGEAGSPIHGWLPHSYQRNDDLIIPCVRRTPQPPEAASSPGTFKSTLDDPLDRMASNLFYEVEVDDATAKRALAYWAKKYAAEGDTLARMEILTEMSRVDRTDTVAQMLEMLAAEKDSRVREQSIVLVGYMRDTNQVIEPVCSALQKAFAASDNERERLRILDVLAILPCAESVQVMRDLVPILGTTVEDVELQVGAADAVLILSTQTTIDDTLAQTVLEPLKQHATNAESRGLRARMVRLLAAPPRKQLPFLLGLLKTEKNARVLEVLTMVAENLERVNQFQADH